MPDELENVPHENIAVIKSTHKPNLPSNLRDKLPQSGKKLLVLLLIILAVPVTVGLALVQQEIRSRASGPERKLVMGMSVYQGGFESRYTAAKTLGIIDGIANQIGQYPATWSIWTAFGDGNYMADIVSDNSRDQRNTFPSTELLDGMTARNITPVIMMTSVGPGLGRGTNPATPPSEAAKRYSNSSIAGTDTTGPYQHGNGSFDTYLTKWANDAKKYKKPVILRYDWEMNGSLGTWSPYRAGGNNGTFYDLGSTPENYVAMWRHVYDKIHPIAPNVKFFWCPSPESVANIAPYYPKNKYVDYVGFDAYDWLEKDKPMLDIYDETIKKVRTLVMGNSSTPSTKPIIIGETGIDTRFVNPKRSNWLKDGYSNIYSSYPDVAAILYFNISGWVLAHPGYPNNEILTAYRDLARDPRFQGGFGNRPLTPILTPTPTPSPGISYFGYFANATDGVGNGDYLGEIKDHANLAWIRGNWAHKLDETHQYGMKAVINPGFTLFVDPTTYQLRPDYLQRWQDFATIIMPYRQDLAAFYIADEPYLNARVKSPPIPDAVVRSSIEQVIQLIKQTFPEVPQAVIFGYPEVNSNLIIPQGYDWVGVDCYGPLDDCHGQPFSSYYETLKSKMSPSQKLIVVPQSFLRTSTLPTESDIKSLLALADDYTRFIQSQDNVVAVVPFLWQTFSDHIGARDIPAVKAKYQAMGRQILGLAISPSPTPPPPDVPIGSLDSVSCIVITGWSCNEINYSSPVNVKLYDGPKEANSVPIADGVANQSRGDVSEMCGGVANHGFNITTPNSIKNGDSHEIWAYPVNADNSISDNPLDSPKVVSCFGSTPAPTPTPTPEPTGCIRTNPIVNIIDNTKSGKPTDTVIYRVKVKDNDNTACGYRKLTFKLIKPKNLKNWTSHFPNVITINPNETKTVNIKVTSGRYARPGVKNLQLIVGGRYKPFKVFNENNQILKYEVK